MLLRLLLLGLLFGAVIRFFGRLFSFILTQRPAVGNKNGQNHKKRSDLDESQIQDADFKDL